MSSAAAWPQRLAVLLAVLAALVAVRGPVCVDGMGATMPGMAASSMPTAMAGAVASAQPGAASMPSLVCAALASATGLSTVDPGSCLQAAPTSVAVPAAAVLAAAGAAGYRCVPAPAPPAGAVVGEW